MLPVKNWSPQLFTSLPFQAIPLSVLRALQCTNVHSTADKSGLWCVLCKRNAVTFHCDGCTGVKSVKCIVLHSTANTKLDVLIMQYLVHCRGGAYRVIQCRELIGLFGSLLGPFLSAGTYFWTQWLECIGRTRSWGVNWELGPGAEVWGNPLFRHLRPTQAPAYCSKPPWGSFGQVQSATWTVQCILSSSISTGPHIVQIFSFFVHLGFCLILPVFF